MDELEKNTNESTFKEEVLKMVDKIREGKATKQDLINLIGKEKLEAIFDPYTVDLIMNNLISKNQIYVNDDKGVGIEALEGLLNKKITGKLFTFYTVKPEYVLSLPPEEQEHLAESFSEGNSTQKEALLTLWKNGVETMGCGDHTRDGNSTDYVYIKIPLDNPGLIKRMGRVVSQGENYIDLDIIMPIEDKKLTFPIYGNTVYDDIIEEFQKEPPKKRDFTDLMIGQVIQQQKEIEASQDKDKKIANLQDRVLRLSDSLSRVKNFVVHKIGKIPFLGKRVLRMMNEEIKGLPTPSKQEEPAKQIASDDEAR